MEARELAAKVDEFLGVEAERLALDRKSKDLKKKENELREYLLAFMQREGVPAIGGTLGTVRTEDRQIPTVRNWEDLYDYILENKAFDLLHRRLTDSAVAARWEDNLEVPGVEKFIVTKLFISRN